MHTRGIKISKVDLSIAYRLFYPQVPLIVCAKFDDTIAAMPAISCMPISTIPPMIALSVFRESRTNYIIARSRRFSINWINHRNEKLRAAVLELGNSFSESVIDKLQEVGVDYGLECGVPVIKGSVAFELCQVERKYREGDHDMFIASVVGARAYDDFVKNWRFRSYKPIFYLGSNRRKQDRLRSF